MNLLGRIERRVASVSIIGQGYVGLPLSIAFAEAGFRVTGLEADPDRVGLLNRGESYIPDVPGPSLRRMLEAGRYRATSDVTTLADQDVVIVCVPTPLRKSREPDMAFVVAATENVARHLRAGQLVILESTTYPGTTEEVLLPMLERGGLKVGADFHLAFSPERIDPGNARFKVGDIPKLVGGVTSVCTKAAALLYRQITPQVRELSGPVTAELAKLYENTFRSVNIALANELALVCHHLKVNVWEVIDAAATKPFGFMPFYPGPGIGGHCIPVDPMYLAWKARLHGYETKFIGLADEINRAMPQFVLSLLTDALNDRGRAIRGSRLLVLGVAYKRGVGDVRESPAVDIVHELLRKGARVQYTDPFVPRLDVGGQLLEAAPLTQGLLSSVDAALILTDHAEFDYQTIVAEAPLVVDTRNATAGLAAPDGRVVRL